MAGNTTPIFSRQGSVQGGVLIVSSSTDYLGVSTATAIVFTADTTNGSFIQRLRFKPGLYNNVATVARIYINEGTLNLASTLTTPGTPAGTTSTTGGSLLAGPFYARVQALDQYGGVTAASAESTVAYVSGTTSGSISWTWTASAGASTYRLFVGPVTQGEYAYFTTTTNTFVQTIAVTPGQVGQPNDFTTNNMYYGELSLPATSTSTSAAQVDIDYPMNFALPPGYRVLVGLGTSVVGGWTVTGIGGTY